MLVALLVLLVIHRVTLWPWVVAVLFNCLILFSLDTGTSFYHHGFVNRVILICTASVILVLYFLV